MTISNTLMTAILAMDSYDQGYTPILAGVGGHIGNATLLPQVDVPAWQPSGFYASAYSFNGQTVISYRGTDDPDPLDSAGDFWTGWVIGTGYLASQAALAEQFYAAVTGQSIFAGTLSNVVLTGHSLGGGLAGYIGAITGDPAIIYDTMPFAQAALYRVIQYDLGQGAASIASLFLPGGTTGFAGLPSASVITSIAVNGEVLQAVRALGPILDGSLTANPAALAYDLVLGLEQTNSLLYSYAPLLANTINLHNDGLMVLLDYASEKGLTDWQSVGIPLYYAYFDAMVAGALGLVQDTSGAAVTATGTTGAGAISSQLLYMIAYSAVDTGVMPFGDTGITSLFNDADTLGQIETANGFTGLLADVNFEVAPGPLNSLAEIAVQFAGDQARAVNTKLALASGAFSVSGNALSVDLNPADWTTTFGSNGAKQIAGLNDFVNAVITDDIGSFFTVSIGGGLIGAVVGSNAVDNFLFANEPTLMQVAIGANATLSGLGAPGSGNAVLVGQNGSGTLTAGNGNNLIVAGATVTAGNGNNIIVGSASGGEAITIGSGNNLVVAQGSGNTINIDGGLAGISFVYAGTGTNTIDFEVNHATEGFIVLPVQNFSVADMLDLDQAKLTAALNSDPAITSALFANETGGINGAGLSGFNWTVIVVPSGQPVTDAFWINGALPLFAPGFPDIITNFYPLNAGSIIDTVSNGTFYFQDQMTGPTATYDLNNFLTLVGPPKIPTGSGSGGGGGGGGTPIVTSLLVNGGNPIGAAIAKAVPFTFGGLDGDDNGTVTFTDGTPAHTVQVQIANGAAPATVDLSGLADGPVTATLSVNPDTGGNIFTNATVSLVLDQDLSEQAALAFTVNGGAPIGATEAASTPFTIAGLEPDDNGSLTFSDGSHTASIAIVNGALAVNTGNLAGFSDGTITATLHLNPDAAGNTFTDVSANATLDQDANEQAALAVAINGGGPIGAGTAAATPFQIAGLEPDDSGQVTFSDGAHSVSIAIALGAPASNTVNLSGFLDGTITATLHLNADPAGNTFSDVQAAGAMEQDLGEQAALAVSFTGSTLIGGASAPATGFTVAGLEPEDTGSVTFTDKAGHSVAVAIAGGQPASSTVNLTSLADGPITATLLVSADPAGNTFTPVTAGATLDATAPVVTISGGGTVFQAAQVVSGTAIAGASSTVALTDNGVAVGGPVAVNAAGQWSALVTLTNGVNTIVATDTDQAGNVGHSAAATFILAQALQVSAASTTLITLPNTVLAFTAANADAITVTDASLASGGTVSVTVSDVAGTLRATKAATGSTVTGSGTHALTIAGTVAAVNADLATLTYRNATPVLDTITVNASDSNGLSAAAAAIAVTVNDAALPVTHVPNAQTVTVGSTLALGAITVTDGNAVLLGETFSVVLSDAGGKLSASAAGGGTVSGNGSTTLTLSGTLAAVDAELAGLTYTNATPTGATPDVITVATTDHFGAAVGSAVVKTVAVNVDAIPRIVAAQTALTTDAGLKVAVPGLSITDTALPGEIFTVIVSDVAGALSAGGLGITHNNSAALTLKGSLAQVNADLATLAYLAPVGTAVGTDAISVAVSGATATVAVTPEVHVVIDPLPVISSDGGQPRAAIIINQGTTGIATVHANETDANDVITYGIAQASSSAIGINPATGALAFAAPQPAGTYTATVAAHDLNGATVTQALTIKVAAGGLMVGTPGIVDTFVFKPGFGADIVQNFVATGATHGILELDHGLFGGVTAGQTGSDVAALLASHITQAGADTFIHSTDASGDVIDLKAVAAATLLANLSDIHFV